jgi:hypothetical protein
MYRHVTGPLATFLPWDSGEPSTTATDDCIHVNINTGKFAVVGCTQLLTHLTACECDANMIDPNAY